MKHTGAKRPSPGETKAKLEQALARAHQTVYWASQYAEELGQEGTAEDLYSILLTLTALGQDQIRRRPGTRRVS